MLACIACSSKEGGEDGSRAAATTPHHGKEAVKSLTSQVPATSISITSEIPTYIFLLRLCLVPPKKIHYTKKIHVTSNLRYMHEVLNIDEIKKLIIQFGCPLRDERFKPN
jgi:hypothetical protein